MGAFDDLVGFDLRRVSSLIRRGDGLIAHSHSFSISPLGTVLRGLVGRLQHSCGLSAQRLSNPVCFELVVAGFILGRNGSQQIEFGLKAADCLRSCPQTRLHGCRVESLAHEGERCVLQTRRIESAIRWARHPTIVGSAANPVRYARRHAPRTTRL